MSVDCPICREIVNTFVTLECSHKICLKCYHQCIHHSHDTCSLCRNKIKDMENTIKHINNFNVEINDYKKSAEYANRLIKLLKDEYSLLEYRLERIEDYNEQNINDDVELYNNMYPY